MSFLYVVLQWKTIISSNDTFRRNLFLGHAKNWCLFHHFQRKKEDLEKECDQLSNLLEVFPLSQMHHHMEKYFKAHFHHSACIFYILWFPNFSALFKRRCRSGASPYGCREAMLFCTFSWAMNVLTNLFKPTLFFAKHTGHLLHIGNFKTQSFSKNCTCSRIQMLWTLRRRNEKTTQHIGSFFANMFHHVELQTETCEWFALCSWFSWTFFSKVLFLWKTTCEQENVHMGF